MGMTDGNENEHELHRVNPMHMHMRRTHMYKNIDIYQLLWESHPHQVRHQDQATALLPSRAEKVSTQVSSSK